MKCGWSKSGKINVGASVRRICLWILALKGLIDRMLKGPLCHAIFSDSAFQLHKVVLKQVETAPNTGFIPKETTNQVLRSCNEVWMVKIGQDQRTANTGSLEKRRPDVFQVQVRSI